VSVSYSISGVVIFAQAKFVNGSYVTTTKELKTSGGSGGVLDSFSCSVGSMASVVQPPVMVITPTRNMTLAMSRLSLIIIMGGSIH